MLSQGDSRRCLGTMSETRTVGQIRTGERMMECPINGDTYRVTKWTETVDGRVRAVEKELVSDE